MKNNIKRYLLGFLALIVFPYSSLAQEDLYSSLEPEAELQVFDFYQHQISFGYGFGSASKWLNQYSNTTNLESVDYFYDDGRFWGSINIKYLYRYSEYITFGLNYTSTGLKRNILERGEVKGLSSIDIHAIMPEFKSDWFRNNFVTLYSKVSVGLLIGSVKERIGTDLHRDIKYDVAFQVSPIGIELGYAVAFYIEAGFGHQGVIITGVRYNF